MFLKVCSNKEKLLGKVNKYEIMLGKGKLLLWIDMNIHNTKITYTVFGNRN